MWRVQAIDPGFAPQNVLTLKTALPRPKYDSPVRRTEFYQRVLAVVRTLPGVQSAAYITGLPMVVTGVITGVDVPGQETRSARSAGVRSTNRTPRRAAYAATRFRRSSNSPGRASRFTGR